MICSTISMVESKFLMQRFCCSIYCFCFFLIALGLNYVVPLYKSQPSKARKWIGIVKKDRLSWIQISELVNDSSVMTWFSCDIKHVDNEIQFYTNRISYEFTWIFFSHNCQNSSITYCLPTSTCFFFYNQRYFFPWEPTFHNVISAWVVTVWFIVMKELKCHLRKQKFMICNFIWNPIDV